MPFILVGNSLDRVFAVLSSSPAAALELRGLPLALMGPEDADNNNPLPLLSLPTVLRSLLIVDVPRMEPQDPWLPLHLWLKRRREKALFVENRRASFYFPALVRRNDNHIHIQMPHANTHAQNHTTLHGGHGSSSILLGRQRQQQRRQEEQVAHSYPHARNRATVQLERNDDGVDSDDDSDDGPPPLRSRASLCSSSSDDVSDDDSVPPLLLSRQTVFGSGGSTLPPGGQSRQGIINQVAHRDSPLTVGTEIVFFCGSAVSAHP